ncbi:MAG: MgtC/SapB family protein [Thiobacillaceae bacterium]|nr:MgtC/SapB family protein [Thiobacillaceae bacterium]
MPDPSLWFPAELDTLPRYLVAAALGLLIGLERERNPSAKAGLRTFALTALFGVLASHLAERTQSPWLIVAGLLLTGGMIIAAYLRQPQEETGDPGTTTIAALVLCYGLGVLSWLEEFQLAVLLGVSATLLLYFKPELRGMSERLTRHASALPATLPCD